MANMIYLPLFDGVLRYMTENLNQAVNVDAQHPRGGEFIDLLGSRYAFIVARLGVVDVADTITIEPKTSDTDSGTLNPIDTAGLAVTVDSTSPKGIVWAIDLGALPEGQRYLTLDTTGGSGNSFFGVHCWLGRQGTVPPEQDELVLPKVQQFVYGGGESYQPS